MTARASIHAPAGQMGQARACWALFWLAAASFLILPFNVQYTGEESAYTIQAYEQWYHQAWLHPTLLGLAYGRPPLFNWLIMVLSTLLGWPHTLAAARLVSALATVGSGLLVAATVQRVWRDPARSARAALIFLTLWEMLFYYGWLAYSDALFGLFTLTAMLTGWLAVREQRAGWLATALLAALLGFMTKALTSYVFLAGMLFASLWAYRAWPLLLRLRFFAGAPLLLLPLAWYRVSPGGSAMASGMLDDVVQKLGYQGAAAYLHHFVVYPLHALSNLLPCAGLLAWSMWRAGFSTAPSPEAHGGSQPPPAAVASTWPARHLSADSHALLAAIILNLLPYWLAPQSSTRYLTPLYGLAAILLTSGFERLPGRHGQLLRWCAATIVLKLIAAAWLFPAYTARVRPDIAAIAHDIDARTRGHALFIEDTSWQGISVAVTLDVQPGPLGGARAPLTHAQDAWQDGWILRAAAAPALPGELRVQQYGELSLHCRGAACPVLQRETPARP